MEEEHPPYHTVTSIDFGVTPNSSLTAMCNEVRFHITIHPENLQHGSRIEVEYLQLLDGLQDPEDQTGSNAELFEDWALEPCLPHFKELAPARPSSRPMTLEEYFDPVTFILILINVNNYLVAKCCPYDPTITAHLAPQVSVSDIPEHMDIPRIKASKVEIVPGPDPMEDATSDPPKRVRIPDGTEFFFKAASESDSFLRELGMLFYFARAGASLRVPKVLYIVESSNRNSVIGMLMNHIDHNGRTLRTALPGSSASARKKWMDQVKKSSISYIGWEWYGETSSQTTS